MQRNNDNISDLALEQFVLGELPASLRERITERLRTDPVLQARLATLQQSDVELRAAYPSDVVTRAILRRAQEKAALRQPFRAWLGLALSACLVALLIVPTLLQRRELEGNRLKGDTSFALERISPDGVPSTLLSGDHARAGDMLQMALHPPMPAYVMVVSIDGAGNATQVVPAEGVAQAMPTATIRPPYLPVTYTLDDAPRFERIFLVTSDAPFDLGPVMAAARQLAADPDAAQAALPLTSPLAQTSILILKD